MEEENLHPVEIDEDVPRLTFAKYGKDPKQEYIPVSNQLPPPGDDAQQVDEIDTDSWKKPAEILAMIINAKLVPEWKVPDDEWQKWADALADVLESIFPGGIGNMKKWGPYAKLAYASGAIAVMGIDLETMTFKPRHKPEEKEIEEEEGDQEQHHQDIPRAAPSSGKRFTTGGE